jgi:hypothetical protein
MNTNNINTIGTTQRANHTYITSATYEIKTKNTTPLKKFQIAKKSWKEAKLISLTHKYDRALSWFGKGISIKRGGVKVMLWTQTCPLSEIMNTTHLLFNMACI